MFQKLYLTLLKVVCNKNDLNVTNCVDLINKFIENSLTL